MVICSAIFGKSFKKEVLYFCHEWVTWECTSWNKNICSSQECHWMPCLHISTSHLVFSTMIFSFVSLTLHLMKMYLFAFQVVLLDNSRFSGSVSSVSKWLLTWNKMSSLPYHPEVVGTKYLVVGTKILGRDSTVNKSRHGLISHRTPHFACWQIS